MDLEASVLIAIVFGRNLDSLKRAIFLPRSDLDIQRIKIAALKTIAESFLFIMF